jgi:SAM-dependent methyltransferase
MNDSYHLREREIAFDSTHPAHLMPTLKPWQLNVLDLGCGGGGPLEALLGQGNWASGIGFDIDPQAIEWGAKNTARSSGMKLSVIQDSTNLPISSGWAHLVMARVSLCYMRIDGTLRELEHVMVDGGELWLALHSYKHTLKMLRKAVHKRDYVDAARICLVIANSFLFHSTGVQILSETLQTERMMRRALKRAGLTCTSCSKEKGFIMTASKLR